LKYNIESYNPIRNIYQKFYHGLCKRGIKYLTASSRVLPDFFVIGVVRSGTTSLFHYLGQHPCIESSEYDEIGYFDDNYHLGINWYKSLFTTKSIKEKIVKENGKFLTYDVTPFYIYNPLVIRRILKDFPDAKLIVNLRNPIDRAYSNYIVALQDGDTNLSFEDFIQPEIELIKNPKIDLHDESFLVDTYYEKILARGLYAEQLKMWYKHFPKKQILVVSSEELARETNDSLRKIFKFLELPDIKIRDISRKNKREYPEMKNETREVLIEFFKPYNKELSNLLEREFNWDR
jgi:hypothetical protein